MKWYTNQDLLTGIFDHSLFWGLEGTLTLLSVCVIYKWKKLQNIKVKLANFLKFLFKEFIYYKENQYKSFYFLEFSFLLER